MFGFSAFAEVPFADIPATTPSGINYSLSCATGSYAVTGNAASFSYVHGNVNYSLACSAGSYAVTGKAASFSYVHGNVNYDLSCKTGTYTVTGFDSNIQYFKGIWAITPKSARTWDLKSLPTTNWDLPLQQVRWVNDFSQVNAWLNDSGFFVSWGTPTQSQQTTWQQINNNQ
jgi:hypothetical protein